MVKYALINTSQRWYAQEVGSSTPPGGNEVGFHNVLFPVGVTYGTSGGPMWRTQVTELDSGGEDRVMRWQESRRSFDVVEEIKDPLDVAEILTFWEARKGGANGFRYKDWSDFSTASDHVGVPTAADVLLFVGDGSTNRCQLFKEYQTVGNEAKFQRVIKLPLTPSWGENILIAVDGTPLTYGTDFTVSDVTGELLLVNTPAAAEEVTGGFYFHTPVRFPVGPDEKLDIKIDTYGTRSITSLPLMELVDSLLGPDDYLYGGASEVDFTAPWQLTPSLGTCIRWHGSSSSTAYLDEAPTLPPGGHYHNVWNNGGGTLTIRTKTQVIGSPLAIGEHCLLDIFKVDSVNTWRMMKGA